MRSAIAIFSLGLGICTAQPVSVSIGAFSVPGDFDGMVHVLTAEKKTKPLQLRKNSFSASMAVPTGKLELYKAVLDPVVAVAQVPLISIDLPADGLPCRVLIWSTSGENKKVTWHGRAYSSGKWPKSCMVLINLTSKAIEIESGKLRKAIPAEGTFIFRGEKEKTGSPVKLYFVDPADSESVKLVFSSVWQVPESHQEILVIRPGQSDGTVTMHSLLTKKSEN
ncbi:hypothetical protein NT6N_13410 [Oceaniferula spumae]|uniref:DUF3108 domain-containing protein n=1 Tax=Oceaniferula spumae TaxID=2979115 RepID=A0AAT9FK27_9BACT